MEAQSTPPPDQIYTWVARIDLRVVTEKSLEECLPSLVEEMKRELRQAVRMVR
jgi:hypothetical protein